MKRPGDSMKMWRLKNPERARLLRRKERRAMKLIEKKIMERRPGAMAPWANRDIMGSLYDMAFDSGMEIDHIVPLFGNGEVCGLHCEANMQIVTRQHNRWKREHRYEQDNNVDILIFPSKRPVRELDEDGQPVIPF